MSDIYPPKFYSLYNGEKVSSNTFLYYGKPQYGYGSREPNQRVWDKWETRIGANTPNFIRNSRTGNLPMNHLGFSFSNTWYPTGSLHYITNSSGGYQWDTTITGAGWSPIFIGVYYKAISDATTFNLENLVKTRINSRLKDQDVNLLQMWAERDQTVRLMTHAISRIGKAYNALKRGNFLAAADALGIHRTLVLKQKAGVFNQSRNLAQGWLELQYGWLPLMSDIFGLSDFLQKSANRKEFMTFHTSKSLSETWTNVDKANGKVETFTDNVTKKVTLKVRRTSSVKTSMSSLGLTNPLSIAWELMPFSFVVDWLVPVGSFISQLDASYGYQFAGACMTTFRKQTYLATQNSTATPPSGYDMWDISLSERGEKISGGREAYLGFSDILALPYFKDPRSATHVANAIALATTRRR